MANSTRPLRRKKNVGVGLPERESKERETRTPGPLACGALVMTLLMTGMTAAGVNNWMGDEQAVRVKGMALLTLLETEIKKALPTDAARSVLQDGRCFRYREVAGLDEATGEPNWGARTYLLGPPADARGRIVLGRGPDLATVASATGGPDGRLATVDDRLEERRPDGRPYQEILCPEIFSPRTGPMFRIQFREGVGEITLRLNRRMPDGSFLLDADLVLTQQVELLR